MADENATTTATDEAAAAAADAKASANAEVAALWAEYQVERDQAVRDRLILHYSPLVKYVAGRVAVGLP